MWKEHNSYEVHCTNIRWKCSINGIIHFKVKGLRGDYQNSDQNSALNPCKQCKCGVVFSEVISDSIIFIKTLWSIIHYLNIFLWMYMQWTSKLCPFQISKHIFGYRYTLKLVSFIVVVTCVSIMSHDYAESNKRNEEKKYFGALTSFSIRWIFTSWKFVVYRFCIDITAK